MDVRCRFCNDAAVGIFEFPGGCICYPEDRRQALCMQHVIRATPLDGMSLVEDLTMEKALMSLDISGKRIFHGETVDVEARLKELESRVAALDADIGAWQSVLQKVTENTAHIITLEQRLAASEGTFRALTPPPAQQPLPDYFQQRLRLEQERQRNDPRCWPRWESLQPIIVSNDSDC